MTYRPLVNRVGRKGKKAKKIVVMKKLLNDLRSENNFAFGQLYRDNVGKITAFVTKNQGTVSDAEDLFQDAMLVLVEKLRQDHFQLTASINTYVYAICKNLWYKKLRDRSYQLSLDEVQDVDFLQSISMAIEDEKGYAERLQGYLTKITDHCNRLIHDLFFRQKAMEEIQRTYGYTTRHNAQNQKHKCVEQIRRVKAAEEKQ